MTPKRARQIAIEYANREVMHVAACVTRALRARYPSAPAMQIDDLHEHWRGVVDRQLELISQVEIECDENSTPVTSPPPPELDYPQGPIARWPTTETLRDWPAPSEPPAGTFDAEEPTAPQRPSRKPTRPVR